MLSTASGRRAIWKSLYTKTLPALARSKDPVQPFWPVTLDHCFGRIILDQVIGQGQKPWNQVIGSPAIRKMTDEQVEASIALGNQIAKGEADLVNLQERSLRARGKDSNNSSRSVNDKASQPTAEKRKRADGMDPKTSNKQMRGTRDETSRQYNNSEGSDVAGKNDIMKPNDNDREGSATSMSMTTGQDVQKAQDAGQTQRANASLSELRSIINSSSLVDHQKAILLALLQIPKGRYTTYGAISDFIGSSPRAVGNGLKNNPFAPEVPCHRVLPADGKLGGYFGQIGKGALVDKKRSLLRDEGVRFDGGGKVVGGPWRGFK